MNFDNPQEEGIKWEKDEEEEEEELNVSKMYKTTRIEWGS